MAVLVTLAVGAFMIGLVRVQFFAFDPIRLFYVNVEMAPGTSLQETLRSVETVEATIGEWQGSGRGSKKPHRFWQGIYNMGFFL